jgi:amino acid transporter
VHPRYQTPYFSTLVTGLLVAIPSLFMQSSLMTDLTSIGTLFAFVIVAGGVMLLPRDNSTAGRSFRLPYINGQYIVPALWVLFCYLLRDRISAAFIHWKDDDLQELLFLLYTVLSGILAVATLLRKLSLIPIIGVLSCAYLLIEIPAISWIWFFGWMGIGLCIYGFYGFRNSHLASTR